MKKIFFAIIFLSPIAHAKQIILDIPQKEIDIVERSVPDAEEWIRNAWQMKVANCAERLVSEEVKKSVDSEEALPAGKDAILDKALLRPKSESVEKERVK